MLKMPQVEFNRSCTDPEWITFSDHQLIKVAKAKQSASLRSSFFILSGLLQVKNLSSPAKTKNAPSQGRFILLLLVIPLGFEPRTHTLKVYCSTS
jgi:hypothetical protein